MGECIALSSSIVFKPLGFLMLEICLGGYPLLVVLEMFTIYGPRVT